MMVTLYINSNAHATILFRLFSVYRAFSSHEPQNTLKSLPVLGDRGRPFSDLIWLFTISCRTLEGVTPDILSASWVVKYLLMRNDL